MTTDLLQLKYPIVLIHGLGARSTYGPVNYFYGLPKLLKEAKNSIYIARLTPWHTIEHRAAQLKLQIEEAFPDSKVNLVGHSMGGLDARYLAARPEFTERVASVTTIGTPNLGSSIGDLALGLMPESALLTFNRLLKAWDSNSGAFKQVGRKYCTEDFQRLAPKMGKVAYFSATSAITKPIYKKSLPIFWLPYHFLTKVEGDNDGFVSVDSAKWGDHICTYTGDHYAQIGQFLGRSRGMDYLKFYRDIFRHLKQQDM
jgi:triacylglycerol lipase